MERANVNNPDAMRLFVALPVPAEVKKRIETIQNGLKTELRRSTVAWTRPEQLHLTLRFFGNVSSEAVDDLKRALQSACNFSALSLTVTGIGLFPNKRNPRVLWVGVQEKTGALALLQNRITAATANFGQRPEDRSFSPHLTLGRIKRMQRADLHTLKAVLESNEHEKLGDWTSGSIELIRSDLGASGAIYTVICEVPFEH